MLAVGETGCHFLPYSKYVCSHCVDFNTMSSIITSDYCVRLSACWEVLSWTQTDACRASASMHAKSVFAHKHVGVCQTEVFSVT